MLAEVLFRELVGRVLVGMQFGVLVMAQAHSCKTDGRMQFGELMQLFWGAA